MSTQPRGELPSRSLPVGKPISSSWERSTLNSCLYWPIFLFKPKTNLIAKSARFGDALPPPLVAVSLAGTRRLQSLLLTTSWYAPFSPHISILFITRGCLEWHFNSITKATFIWTTLTYSRQPHWILPTSILDHIPSIFICTSFVVHLLLTSLNAFDGC